MADFRNRLGVSPPSTTDLHPGYPYREHTNEDTDLPKVPYPRPYLAAQTNSVTGEPRILGRASQEEDARYDEGPLEAQPVEDVDEDMEEEVGHYPMGENAYLDTNFLQAMGTLDDRGLAAEGLRMIQAEGEFRALNQWEKRLSNREKDLHNERVDLIQQKERLQKRQEEVQARLRLAKAASRLIPLLPDRTGQPGMSFPHANRPYPRPNEQERRQGTCYWCGRGGLEGHRGRDCEHPHRRCTILAPGRCLVPDHHRSYYSYVDSTACPYNGDQKGRRLRGDHA
jgi:hypothetical protein